jgi:hypothetical protein
MKVISNRDTTLHIVTDNLFLVCNLYALKIANGLKGLRIMSNCRDQY